MGISVTPAIVGALQCQKNSFLKEFQTVIVSCEEEEEEEPLGKSKKSKSKSNNDVPKKSKFAVELKDTILFPEGGGQPSDEGFIITKDGTRHHVKYIKRDGLRAIHIVDNALEVGQTVSLELDWRKRLDHMQQHTGQHLLSAVLDKYEIPTLSWSMGEMINYVELARTLTEQEVEKVSEEVNEKISDSITITVETPEKELVKQDKIPDDYDVSKGVLRVIKIGELDQNPCCGTHLTSTAQILTMALLHQTRVRGSNSRLHFIAGDRVRQFSVNSHKILKQSSGDLSCQFDELSDKINQLNLNYRKTLKRETSWRDEVATYQAKELLNQLNNQDFAHLHRPDADLSYLSSILKNFPKDFPQGKTLVLLSGEGQQGGSIIINSFNAEKSMEIGKHLQTLISQLKGGGKAKWQGKINAFEKGELEAAISYLKSLK